MALPRRQGAGIVEFYLDKHSSVAQIEEQIKLAVAMGVLRNGDRLPSIRTIENQTGVNRGKIHRAYLSLQQAGLLLSGRRGVAIAAPVVSDRAMSQKCLKLSKQTIQKARQQGIPPVIFGRYLNRQVQEAEHREPFIAFADDVLEVAERRAEEIARLWQVPVIGMTVQQIKNARNMGWMPQKILANHLRRNYIRSMISSRAVDVIPIEVVYTEKTIRDLAKIKAHSSVLRIFAQPFVKNARFIIAQLRKWIRATGVRIAWISTRDISNLKPFLDGTPYDRVIVDTGILNVIPESMLRNPKILLIQWKLSPESLDAARIRAGVII
jgi:DNA-binding transcriptional regulator YhcF (GntR family)